MRKIITRVLIISIILILSCSLFISQNSHHLEICENDHCLICAIIHIAQSILGLTIIIFIYITSILFIRYNLSRIRKKAQNLLQYSLVIQKVQLNE